MSYKLVIFDFDGTLARLFSGVGTERLIFELVKLIEVDEVLARFQIELSGDVWPPSDPFVILAIAYRRCLEVSNDLDMAAEAMRPLLRHLSRYELEAAESATIENGAEVLLHGLIGSGLQLALVSNNHGGAVERVLERFGLSGLFGFVGGRPDDIRGLKPSPVVTRAALEAMNVAGSDAVVVGDRLSDVEAALEAGCDAIGYASRAEKSEIFVNAGFDRIVTQLTALLDYPGLRRDEP